jgi:hypothetical protein
MQKNDQQRLEKLADIQEGLVLISFPVYVRAVPEINVRGGREAPFKTYNHPS